MVTDEATPQPAAPEVGPDQKAAAAPDVSAAEAAVLGLALSGGGVRAALFSLGVVVGLIATGCHRRVRCIASVSGGSILNAALAHGDRLAGLSDVTAFEPLASNLAASMASRGVFAFSLRTVGSAAWYLARVVARAIVPLAIGVPLMLAKLADVLRDDFKLDLSQFDYRSLPWEVLGWVMLASLLISALLSRGLFQEARFGSVLSSVASHRGRLNVEEWGKKGKGPDVMHVLVATDLLSGEPMYFSNKFIYCRPYGWSTPKNIGTAEALYSSAAFPGVFPPKTLRTKRLSFQNGDMPGPLPPILRLADGGVYNNLGNDWFEILKRQSRMSPPLLWRFGELDVEPSAIEPKNVIIVNAGAPSRRVRWLFPFTTLARIMSVLYDNTVQPRVKLIQNDELPLIDIRETPLKLATRLAERQNDLSSPAYELMTKLQDRTDDFWADFTRDTAGTPTKLTGAGRRTAARLMLHGYLSSIILLYSRFDGQLPERIEGEAYFLKLIDEEPPRVACTPQGFRA